MIRLRALGQCVFEVGAHRLTPESDVLFALLLYLVSRASQRIPRAELLELLWPAVSPMRRRHCLRQALYQLKRLAVPIHAFESVIVLDAADVELDYQACCEQRDARTILGTDDKRLEYLPFYGPTTSERFAQWLESERDRVHALLRRHLLDVIREKRIAGEHVDTVRLAHACLELDPLNAEATFALAEAEALAGSTSEALRLLDRFRHELRDDVPSVTAALALRKRIIHVEGSAPRSEPLVEPLVGRDSMIHEISCWTSPANRPSQALLLSGEAGIGKTRIVSEATRVAMLHGLRTVHYRPSANGAERPLAGLLDLLPPLLALPGAVGCSPDSYRRLQEVTGGRQAERTIPEDLDDSAFRFAALRRSVLDLVDAILTESELMVAIDDAHCLDLPTLEILLDATRPNPRGLLLLLAMRPDGSTARLLDKRSGIRSIRIPKLDPETSRMVMVRRLSPAVAQNHAKLVEWAIDIANGNPFFLVELAAHCSGENPSESLPASLKIALGRRLDVLSATARLVLQSCAILAQNSTLSRLESMLQLSPYATAQALGELETAGLVAHRDDTVGCRHDLISETVTATFGPTIAAYLHRRCAIVLDSELRVAPTASLAWDCAFHWDAAGEHTRAFELTAQITEQLLLLGLPQAAADLCARAERYCKTAAQDAERLLRLSRARRLLDDWSGVIEALERRRSLVNAPAVAGSQYTEDEIALFEARWWRDHDGRVLRPALNRVRDSRAPTLHRLQMAVIGLVIADNHQQKRAAEQIYGAVESLVTVTPREDIELARAALVYHSAFGVLDLAVSAAFEVVRSERLTGESAALLRALRWATIPMKFTGHVSEAVALLEEAHERAMRLGLRSEMWHAAEYLTSLAVECEDRNLADQWAPVCYKLAMEDPSQTSKTFRSRYLLSRTVLMRGDARKAREIFRIESISPHDAVLKTRARETAIAMDAVLRLSTSKRGVPRRMLAELQRLHLTTRESGTRDFEAGALILALVRAGQADSARKLYVDYTGHYRRSRLPLHSMFHEAQRALLEPT
jgi:DNA-binding SARP family transcriptional activator